VADVTKELREKSNAELQFYLDNNRWPDDHELAALQNDSRTQ
jgi:hypothetical protein